ncbi:MAG TPA: hypothetical protein VF371_01090 [Candidatus Limnocylindrales bacterium]
MERSLNRPSYVLALLLGVVALVDAGSALLAMQIPGPCSGNNFSGVGCGSNAGWVIDLAAAGISAALVACLLMRPHLYVFGATVGWAALALVANFALRHSGTIDAPATYRMTAYFVVLVIAGVLLVVEGKPRWDAERATRPVAQMPPGWPNTGYAAPTAPYPPAPTAPYPPAQMRYSAPPPYFVAPVPAPAAPAAPPLEPAAPAEPGAPADK